VIDRVVPLNKTAFALLPIIAIPGSEIAPPLALQIRRCSLGCNGGLLGQTCHARLWPAGPLMVESRCGAVAVGRTYLLPPLSSGGALVVRP
jgi:hypothetical protein